MKCSRSVEDSGFKTILITGGCGFIGTNLVKYLADKGYRIRILDNLSVGKEENLRKAQTYFDLVIGDIRDRKIVERTIEGVDGVVHLAAHTSVVESLENPEEDWDINANGTLNFLEACRKTGVAKFIFASSNAAVGEQTPPIDEWKVPRPVSPYGASKLAGEALAFSYYHSFGLRTISLRFANCYGPYAEHKTSVVNRFMKWARKGKPLIIFGDGNQTRDFIHVDDVCHAIYLALVITQQPPPAKPADLYGGAFQIGSGIETSVNKLAGMMAELVGRDLKVIHQPERKGEISRNYSNIGKARQILNFEPRVSLKEGLQKL